jgi:hypothetical protein
MVFVGCWNYTLSLVTLIIINYTTFNVVTLIGVESFESNVFFHVLMSKIILMNITNHSKKSLGIITNVFKHHKDFFWGEIL